MHLSKSALFAGVGFCVYAHAFPTEYDLYERSADIQAYQHDDLYARDLWSDSLLKRSPSNPYGDRILFRREAYAYAIAEAMAEAEAHQQAANDAQDDIDLAQKTIDSHNKYINEGADKIGNLEDEGTPEAKAKIERLKGQVLAHHNSKVKAEAEIKRLKEIKHNHKVAEGKSTSVGEALGARPGGHH